MGRKKKIEDFEVEVKTNKVSVKAKKEGKKLDAEVKTPKVKATLKKDEDKKEFVYDGQKLDVTVTEENGQVKANVEADNKILRSIGNAAVRIFSRNFRRKK
jgi:DNA topoisomerase IB